jgi:hypothetical protein
LFLHLIISIVDNKSSNYVTISDSGVPIAAHSLLYDSPRGMLSRGCAKGLLTGPFDLDAVCIVITVAASEICTVGLLSSKLVGWNSEKVSVF